MAVHGLRAYTNFAPLFGSSAGFVRTGVIWAADDPGREQLERNVATARAAGADLTLLAPDDLAQIDPRIAVDGLAAACFEPTGGCCDPYLATVGFAAAARRAGARIEEGVTVQAVADGGVETGRGRVDAGAVVVAAGPWTPALTAPLGYHLPIRPARAEVGRWRIPVGFDPAPPAIADLSELDVYVKPGEPGYLEVGALDPAHAERTVDPDRCPEGAEPESLARLERSLLRRIPALRGGHWRGAWSGVYDVTPDWHPAIGLVPGTEHVVVAAGFSGHGLKLAPAVGAAVADLVCGEAGRTFDLSPLAPDRFERGALVAETQYASVVS
jgi:glycine/D-amino acid oxidase-like deaminating enzyme